MNKKIKTFLLLILTIIGAFIGIDKVKAEPYGGRLVRGDRIGFTYTQVSSNNELWDHVRWLQRTNDGGFVYCVQPFMVVNPDGTYNVTTEDFAIDFCLCSYFLFSIKCLAVFSSFTS